MQKIMAAYAHYESTARCRMAKEYDHESQLSFHRQFCEQWYSIVENMRHGHLSRKNFLETFRASELKKHMKAWCESIFTNGCACEMK